MSKFVFLDGKGHLLTQRINQTDCKPTVAWLGMMRPDLNLLENMVGSTGLTNTSANIDLVYDKNLATPDELYAMFAKWAKSYDKKPSHFTQKIKNVVYFKCPIAGNPTKGFVQVNLYPTSDVEFSRFMMRTTAESQYKCRERNALLNSIAYTAGYKINPLSGLICLKTNKIKTRNLDEITQIILNSVSPRDMITVERLLSLLANDNERNKKIDKFLHHLEDNGIPFVDDYYSAPVHYMARLRDRIINKGLQPILESARIEHLEDLVFERGTSGVRDALEIISHSAKNSQDITPKIDGKICLVWGRKPSGEFVLTDKSGFTAKTYDGLHTTIEGLSEMMHNRGRGREDLIRILEKIYPVLEKATPKNFKGFVKGDLLFADTPPEIRGALTFRPNYVEYKIPVDSDLGKKLQDREIAIVAHTYCEDKESIEHALDKLKHHSVPGLALIHPSDFGADGFTVANEIIDEITAILDLHGDDINTLFNPLELRTQKITDLPALCKRYINSRLHDSYQELLPRFLHWLKTTVTERKFNRIIEYLGSPRSNEEALGAVFAIFLLLHDLKTDALTKLDRKHPGHEGWVLNHQDLGKVKLVDRKNFTVGNRAMWAERKNARIK